MKPRLLLIDNYDSFTYNLVQAFLVLGADVHVHRNDQIGVDEAVALEPTHLCISPGPGTPADAGVSMQMIEHFAGAVPVLGVCLGHQALVEVFGGAIVRAPRLMHGKTSTVRTTGAACSPGCRIRSGGALSLADRRARPAARRARRDGLDRGGRDHGRAASRARGRGRAVPPGEHPDARGPATAGLIPRRGCRMNRPGKEALDSLLERRDLSEARPSIC